MFMFSGCNVWVFCPKVDGCSNGYATVYPFGQCNVKYQAGLGPGVAPLVYGPGMENYTTFTSGKANTHSQVRIRCGMVPSNRTADDGNFFSEYKMDISIVLKFIVSMWCEARLLEWFGMLEFGVLECAFFYALKQ